SAVVSFRCRPLGRWSHMPGHRTRDADASPEQTIESLVDRVAQLEAILAERAASVETPAAVDGDTTRKPKGGPIDAGMRKSLVAKRERLELARLAEQAAWEDLKVAVRLAAESGVSYREIG